MPCASGISLTPGPMLQIAPPDWWRHPRKTSALNHPARRRGGNETQPLLFGVRSRQGGQGHQGQGSQDKGRTGKTAKTTEADGEPKAPDAPLEPLTVSAAPAVPEAVPAAPERARTSRAFALVAALALATVAAYFSVAGMAEIFPGDPVAVMVLAAPWKPASW